MTRGPDGDKAVAMLAQIKQPQSKKLIQHLTVPLAHRKLEQLDFVSVDLELMFQPIRDLGRATLHEWRNTGGNNHTHERSEMELAGGMLGPIRKPLRHVSDVILC